ncbi:molecular chaperone DnaJ, partial [Candidatus Peregrinibacteria bacterium]|nr:molecular chaperone DnaJ [Candidatus Peregrinibacteria bacterium]
EKFKKASSAYETLSDPQKKAQYDQFGSTGGSGFGGFGGNQGFHAEEGGFGDIFDTFFGGGFSGGGTQQRRKRSNRGADLEAQVKINFEQSVSGTTKELHVNKNESCEYCYGSGSAKESSKKTCSDCSGTGQVARVQQTPLGAIRMQQTCHKCAGEGEIIESPCKHCHGEGRAEKASKMKIKIPAGVADGTTIRLSGKGEAGRQSGGNGDLYVRVQVTPSKEFIRKGDDIFSSKEIHVLQAILGDEIEVKTVHGNIKLKIPAGTQPEKMFRIKAHGMPLTSSTEVKGNHYVTLKIKIPEKLSKKDKEHYGELVRESKLTIIPEEKSFFESLWN